MHFEFIIILIPILMLIEYYSRYFAKKFYLKKYNQYIEIEGYSEIPQEINYVYFFKIILSTIVLYLIFNYLNLDYNAKRFITSFYITSFALAISMNFFNLMVYWYTIKHPNEISGHVKISSKFHKKISLILLFALLLPFIFTAIYLPDPFIYGAIIGIVILIISTNFAKIK